MELMEDGTTIEQQMFAMATEKKVPLYGVLELLPLCNLNCDMCYVRMSREEMEEVGRLRTMEEWTKTAEDMMRAGTLFVLLTGGEPLLYPHFRELYQKLRELGMIITINTNGTLIDEAWADFFAENKPRRINIIEKTKEFLKNIQIFILHFMVQAMRLMSVCATIREDSIRR